MGRKGKDKGAKDEVPPTDAVPNRDILQRLNFLYQASAYLTELSASTSNQRHGKEPGDLQNRRRTRRSARRDPTIIQEPKNLVSTDAARITEANEVQELRDNVRIPCSRRTKTGIGSNGKSRKSLKTSAHLARAYVKSMRIIGLKTTVRMYVRP